MLQGGLEKGVPCLRDKLRRYCAYWILKIAKMQDITINLYHMMDFGNRRFTARIVNTGEIIHTMDEFVLVAAGVQKL